MTKKMVCIVKVGGEKFVKYHVNNLLKFTEYLDREYPDWRFINVFDSKSERQVANYTKNKRPGAKHVY